MGQSDWVHIEVARIIEETDKALLCYVTKIPDSTEQGDYWIPKSVISDPDDYSKGDKNCEMSVKEWFAKKEGWIP